MPTDPTSAPPTPTPADRQRDLAAELEARP
jgi:hypothetical protein